MARKVTMDQFVVELENFRGGITRVLEDAVGDSAEIVASTARDNCTPGMSPYDGMAFKSKHPFESGAPFKTGNLRDSIQSGVADKGNNKIAGVVYTNVEYSNYVHDGTSKMQPRPFILDAFIERQPEIKVIMEEAIEDYVKETFG